MIQQETVNALAGHVFLKGMSREHLQKLADCTQWITITAGQHLGREREPANAFYLILSGRIGIEIPSADRRPVRLQTLGPGEVVGWSWILPPHRWQFDAVVIDLVQALAVDAVTLRRQCDEDPAFGYDLLKRLLGVVVGRLSATRRRLLSYME